MEVFIMTAEDIRLNRPIFLTLNLNSFNQKNRGIPLSNSEIILLVQSLASNGEPNIDECIPINFCDDI